MDQIITDFIQQKTLALVGASRSGRSFGNTLYKELTQRGYQVFLVHPQAKEIDGQPCYADLASLPGKVGGVVVCVAPAQGEAVLRQAASLGITRLWLQQGASSPYLVALGKQLDLKLVTGKCIMMYAEPVHSFHGWHRAVNKFFGKL
jgi:predicted CoA-binding protein